MRARLVGLVAAGRLLVGCSSSTDADAPESTAGSTGASTSAPVSRPSAAMVPTVELEGSVLGTIDQTPELSNFARLAHAPGVESVFTQERGVTVFAPDNNTLSTEEVDALLADSNGLMTFVSRHLFIGRTVFAELGSTVTTATGQSFPVDLANSSIGGIPVTTKDLAATNGVVNVLAGQLAAE